MENKIKVYVKINSNNCITEINSSIFLKNIDNYIEIDEGVGDKYAHAQNMYLEKSLTDNKGRCNYKYINGSIIELTEEEKGILFPVKQPQSTETELLKQQLLDTQAMIVDLTEKLLTKENGGI